MYSHLLKKAICIMGAIVALLFSVVGANAASTSASITVTSGYMEIDNSYEEENQDINNKHIYVTYKREFPVAIYPSGVDGYINGYYVASIKMLTEQAPSNYTIVGRNINFTPSYTNRNMTPLYTTDSTTYIRIGCAFDNFWNESVGNRPILGTISYTITYCTLVANGINNNIYLRVSVESDVSSNMTITSEPQDKGFEGVIREAILNALNDTQYNGNNVLSVYQILIDYWQYLYSINQSGIENGTKLNTISGYIYDLTQDIVTIVSQQADMQEKLRTFESEFTSFYQYIRQEYPLFEDWYKKIYNELQILTYANSTQQAQSQENAYNQQIREEQQESISAGLAIEKPQLNNIDFNVWEGQDSNTITIFGGFLRNILGNGFIVKLGIIFLTCAIIGFLLYGKGNKG